MAILAARVIVIVALPVVVFVAGAFIISEMSGRPEVKHRLRDAAAPQDQKPLNERFGYDAGAVHRYWAALDDKTRRGEQRFLEFDLVLPFLYGAAFATSLLMAWGILGRPFNPVWVLWPVAIRVLADWTENLVQLGQLRRYIASGATGLQGGWIQVASVATILKLLFFSAASVLLVFLVVVILVRELRPT